MKSRIADIWIRTQGSYWFIPGLMSIAALIGALILVRVDYAIGDDWLDSFEWLRINQATSAQALLSTVAGSMITVAGVTFSMTLLAVSHATSQIGAHLLSAFMRDRGNQLTLGTFIATFIYCLTLLRSVHTADPAGMATAQEFVPQIAVLGSLLFTAMSVAVLIYFIHHVPQSINVTNVVARVGEDLIACIRSLYPEDVGKPDSKEQQEASARPHTSPTTLTTPDPGGYLRIIDSSALMDVAERANLLVEVRQHPGHFALPGEELMHVWTEHGIDDALKDELRSCFTWGTERTLSQDVLFPVQQLLEIIGRALSPGINNQYTALLCIDQLGRGIREMMQRKVPERQRVNAEGKVRVIAEAIDHQAFFQALVPPLLQYVHGDGIASSHVHEIFSRLSNLPDLPHGRACLQEALTHFRPPREVQMPA